MSASNTLRALACILLVLIATTDAIGQSWGELAGRISESGTTEGVPGATVLIEGTNFGTAADANGRYRLRLPEGRYPVLVTAVGFEPARDTVSINRGTTLLRDYTLLSRTFELGDAIVEGRGEVRDAGVFSIRPEDARNIPAPLPDGLRAIQVLPGVTSNNETSSAYSVRGGGYNENAFFVNGFELYRPFRTRQGEQEGLSFLNLDLAEQITLYAGGFPARYGGKLASTLDVTYGRPRNEISGTASASTLDAGATVRYGTQDGRVGVGLAARSARASRFFNTQELKGQYAPAFSDVQGIIGYTITPGHELEVVGIYAEHSFDFDPISRRTTFGIFPRLSTVTYAYSGSEEDAYTLAFGGVRMVSTFPGGWRIEHRADRFAIEETESFDISGAVTLYQIENPFEDPNDPSNLIRTGAALQRDTADNRVRIETLTAAGRYQLNRGRHLAEAGWTLRRLQFEDELFEQTIVRGRDSENNPIDVTVTALDDRASLDAVQAALYAQNTIDLLPQPDRLVLTLGLRGDYFSFNEELTLSPRVSARYLLREGTTLVGAAGVYYQTPTYREFRGKPAPGETILGALNPDLRSQRATQLVVGAEHFFPNTRFWGRAEAYYKLLDRLISYDVDNVRVEYSGDNDASGHTYGLDLQIRGEFVPGLESWLNYGFLVAREQFQPGFETPNNLGLIARPTDRRHNFSVFVQDYIPGDDRWRLHLRALFGTGLPYTAPEPGESIGTVTPQNPGLRNSQRFPAYTRFDMGATRRLIIAPAGPSGQPLSLSLTAEILNVFDMQNTITYSWVSGSSGVWQRIPTRLTPRTVNLRMRVDF
ncbi:TonB-dependent receptor [soil metagenome]